MSNTDIFIGFDSNYKLSLVSEVDTAGMIRMVTFCPVLICDTRRNLHNNVNNMIVRKGDSLRFQNPFYGNVQKDERIVFR